MKIKYASKLTALVLALLLIVPAIGIPTFAQGQYLFEETFTTTASLVECGTNWGSASPAPLKQLIHASRENPDIATSDDMAIWVDSNTNGAKPSSTSTAAGYNPFVNKSLAFATPRVSYDLTYATGVNKNNTVVTHEVDCFLEDGSNFIIAAEIGVIKTSTNDYYYQVPLWHIEAQSSGNTLFVAGEKNMTSKLYIPSGEWFTVSTVIDLVSGATTVYIDGELAGSNRLYKNNKTPKNPTNFTINGTSANLPAGFLIKLVNPSSYNSSYTAYNGRYGIDNLRVFEGTDLIKDPAAEITALLDGIITTSDVASIRLASPYGLRFATEIDQEKWATLTSLLESGELSAASYGTLIAPLDLLSGNAANLTFAAAQKLDVQANWGAFLNVDSATDPDDSATKHFAGSIVNIMTGNIDRDFVGRGYIKVTLPHGTELVIYSATAKTISIKDQAQSTLDAVTNGTIALSDEHKAIVQAFAEYSAN